MDEVFGTHSAYGKVTVTDRDSLPPAGPNRRDVPQQQHVHALLPSRAGILEDLFPGCLLIWSAAELRWRATSPRRGIVPAASAPIPASETPVQN
jgi:hypothetical protein